jgi:hypothetical protein
MMRARCRERAAGARSFPKYSPQASAREDFLSLRGFPAAKKIARDQQ